MQTRDTEEGSWTVDATRGTILVVDDDLDIRRNLVDLFSEFGYRVEAAKCGHIALEQARREVYDMGLLDLRCPAWTA
jgi:CheY-like chemotaxis protein